MSVSGCCFLSLSLPPCLLVTWTATACSMSFLLKNEDSNYFGLLLSFSLSASLLVGTHWTLIATALLVFCCFIYGVWRGLDRPPCEAIIFVPLPPAAQDALETRHGHSQSEKGLLHFGS